jgi:hypothetical protein
LERGARITTFFEHLWGFRADFGGPAACPDGIVPQKNGRKGVVFGHSKGEIAKQSRIVEAVLESWAERASSRVV